MARVAAIVLLQCLSKSREKMGLGGSIVKVQGARLFAMPLLLQRNVAHNEMG